MLTFLFHVLIGYVLCILFPCPWLSAKVLGLWQSYGVTAVADVEDIIHGETPAPAPEPAPVVVEPTPVPVEPVAPVVVSTPENPAAE